MEQHIRLLHADEIECRTALVNEKGISLLLYKDARVDQKILDETFGMFGWKRSHQYMNGSLFCTVEIYDKESGCWVAKQDVGTVGNYEKEKSQASDSFKRACFNWGIGRELYTAPFIWVPPTDAEIKKKDGKFFCNDRFSVSSVSYNSSREIVSLAIANESRKGAIAYRFGPGDMQAAPAQTGGETQAKPVNSPAGGITDKQVHNFEAELQRTGVKLDAVKNRYGFDEPQSMPAELYSKVMQALAKTKSAGSAA